jgi:hypothetical protein
MKLSLSAMSGRAVTAIVLSAVFAGCAVVSSQRALEPAARKSLTSVAIVKPKNPGTYYVLSGAEFPAGHEIYLTDIVGVSALFGIQAKHVSNQSNAFTARVEPYRPDVGSALADAMKSEFERRGVKVRVIDTPPMLADGKTYDYSALVIPEQMIVESNIGAGYVKNEGPFRPTASAVVRVRDAATRGEKFFDTFFYGEKRWPEQNAIEAASTADFADADALMANGERASKAMVTAATAIAARAVSAIKD